MLSQHHNSNLPAHKFNFPLEMEIEIAENICLINNAISYTHLKYIPVTPFWKSIRYYWMEHFLEKLC